MSNAINAKDLRIGNHIQDAGGSSFTVHTIYGGIEPAINVSEDPEDRSDYFKLIDVFGIPLTEEWLRRFGFEHEYESKYRKVYGLSTIGRHWTFNFSKTSKEKDHFEVKGFAIDMDLVKYVHQLQNLYFALTGEELTLKD